ncbi:MAG: U32 family peptidase C-terminal domain-containing protein [Parcubacteria group bacterium]|jgi:putative protease
MKHIELLAPAGDLDKLKYAIEYGADAIYFGVPDFSLRARINKFSEKTLKEGVEYAHAKKKKVYVTLNIYAHNRHMLAIERHLKFLHPLKIDGVIVSDPGIMSLVKKHLPHVDIHLSTQANTTNWQAVKFWKEQGVKRIILAREVTLSEIKEIRKKVPNIELEYFVHGAMCMSYSGRCILSKWMTSRSANLGDCSQPCRWKYGAVNSDQGSMNKKELRIRDDQKRYEMNIEEDQHGTYFFNSYDMNLIEHVKDLIDVGVTSLKIEGRAKSVYYVAVVTRAYRKVIDTVETQNFASVQKIISEQKKELDKLTNRGYSKGFLLGAEPPHDFSDRMRIADFSFVGEIIGDWENEGNKGNSVRVHNTLFKKDKLEAITPSGNFRIKIKEVLNFEGKKVTEAHGGTDKTFYIKFNKLLEKGNIIRKIG